MKKLIRNILVEGRVEDVYKSFKQDIDLDREYSNPSVYDYYVQSDFMKETKYKYLRWAVDVWYNNKFGGDTYGYDNIIGLLIEFHTNLSTIPNKDIFSYKTISDLEEAIQEDRRRSDEKRSLEKVKKDVVRVYEDEDFLVIKPLTYESSCVYGGGTKWCTASKTTDSHFKSYTSNGNLYYIIDKKRSQQHPLYKMAVHIRNKRMETAQIFNAPDTRINGELKDIFPDYIIKAINDDLKSGLVRPGDMSTPKGVWLTFLNNLQIPNQESNSFDYTKSDYGDGVLRIKMRPRIIRGVQSRNTSINTNASIFVRFIEESNLLQIQYFFDGNESKFLYVDLKEQISGYGDDYVTMLEIIYIQIELEILQKLRDLIY